MRSLGALAFLVVLLVAVAASGVAYAQPIDVARIQSALAARGFDPGPVDGATGPRTRDAVRAYQTQAGLPATGELDQATLDRLFAAPLSAPATALPVARPTATPSTSQSSEASSLIWWVLGGLALVGTVLWGGRRKSVQERESLDGSAIPKSVAPFAGASPRRGRQSLHQPEQWQWIGPNQVADVAGHRVGGFLYVGSGLRSQRTRDIENCLVNPGLDVATRGADRAGASLPYWPSYATIDEQCRLAYLEWLAGGRSDPAIGIGYVFLFFYGLERRLFVDPHGPEDRAAVVAEVNRLRALYASNRSFERYSRELIEAATLLTATESEPGPIDDRLSGSQMPISLRLALSQKVVRGEPLSAEWMLSWWINHPETKLRTGVRRALPEFRQLFLMRFREQVPGGVVVRAPKNPLTHTYRAASGTFEHSFANELRGQVDVASLRKPLTTASAIADACADELDAYGRFLGRTPDGRDTAEGHALLPEDLAALVPNQELDELRAWAVAQTETNEGLVPLETLLRRLARKVPERISRGTMRSAADALARLSIGLAPDPEHGFRIALPAEPVVLFRLPNGIEPQVSVAYPAALLMLSLGTLVAHADGAVADSERKRLLGHVEGADGLSGVDRAHLRANLAWFSAVPPKLGQVRGRLAALGDADRRALGQLALAVAAADGAIRPTEIKAVQSIYRAIGLDEKGVFGDLHAVAVEPASSDPVPVSMTGRPERGHAIPRPPANKSAAESGVRLDPAKISAIMADTTRVSSVLGRIFAVEDEEPEPDNGATSDPGAGALLDGLDQGHRRLVEELVTRNAWTAAEFAALAEGFGLMPAGASETVNEWSFERFDDQLIDEDYSINAVIAAQLNGSSGEPAHAAA